MSRFALILNILAMSLVLAVGHSAMNSNLTFIKHKTDWDAYECADVGDPNKDGKLAPRDGALGSQESKTETQKGGANGGVKPPESSTEISFSKDILGMFKEQKCTVCHRGENPSGLDLLDEVAYKNLVNVKTNDKESLQVKPGDPEASYLYVKLIGAGRDGTVMPPKGKLEDTEINKVAQWIKQGAKNN